MNNTMKNLLEGLKIDNQMLEFINEYNKEEYPIKWYENKAQIELLEYLIENFNEYKIPYNTLFGKYNSAIMKIEKIKNILSSK